MSKIIHIVLMNRRTFYRYDTGKPRHIFMVYLPMIVSCAVLSLLYGGASDDFLNGVIAAQAILVGFAFSVMFQIGSGLDQSNPSSHSIEEKLRRERTSKLTSEIFYNVSYFIMTAIFCVVLALVLMLQNEEKIIYLKSVACLIRKWAQERFPKSLPSLDGIAYYAVGFLKISTPAIFYFFLEDSLYTFVRVVGRVIYLFERRNL